MTIVLSRELTGDILDLGGGGEGVIGRIYAGQVTAIDVSREELDEAPCVCRKVVMDATAMIFPDASFDHVTSFYTLMYMTAEQQRQALLETARVLRPGGMLHIWDAAFPAPYPEPFLAELDIDAAGTPIHTTYGVIKLDGQSADSIVALAADAGLVPAGREEKAGHFRLRFVRHDGLQ
ncbi:MAG: class I SAM-dependent methyltransferase [Eubacteriales bacterium]|nr:class I SAM-dependent methyltransferase [Eubacteriales bacterium]